MVTVKIGQKWQDCDPRCHTRIGVVLEIEGNRARVGWNTGVHTWVQLDRFEPQPNTGGKGYRLLEILS